MKKGNFYLGAFIALAMGALVGCSKDDDGTAKVTPDMTTAYANISIVMPNAGTRATTDDGENDGTYEDSAEFEYGTAAENKIGSLLLVFYDAQGNVVGSSTNTDLGTKTHPTGGSTATLYSNTIKIKLNEGANMPASVMAYVNPANTSDQNTRLASVMNLTRNAHTNTDENFLMNNSGYYNAGVYTVATSVNASYIFESEETARENNNKLAAEITVERVAAKVVVDFDTTKITDVDAKNGETGYKLKFTPEGWDLTATAKSTMLIKNMNPSLADLNGQIKDNAWVFGTNRTYWARSYGYYSGIGLPENETPTFPDTGVGAATSNVVNYKQYKDVGSHNFQDKNFAYTLENTMRASRFNDAEKIANPYASVTSVVIKGYYTVNDADGNKVDDFNDGFYIRNYTQIDDKGNAKSVYKIYTEAQLIDAMLENQQIFRTSEDGKTFDKNCIELKRIDNAYDITGNKIPNPANRQTIQIKAGTTIFVPTRNDADGSITWIEATDITDANKKLAEYAGQAMYYASIDNGANGKQGQAFFYVPIKHYIPNDSNKNLAIINPKNVKTGYYGIVRNHVYKLKINKIEGLASGIADPNDTPLPDPTPTQTYFINATMNVLAWHIMSQSVDL